VSTDVNRRRSAYWDKQASRYDGAMNFWDRHLFGDSRPWVCGRTAGDVLEVAIGTGRNLPYFPDSSFDTVLCAFGLCAIPDDRRAVTEMARVLRPGGRLLLADHVAASASALRAVQWLYERISVPLAGEYFRRRPLIYVRELGFLIEESERFKLGVVERVCARKPR
jgi:SAM-dependent methyltransferase